ncbi:hypothetical protein TNCV_1790651 [Trichonephila clavipes]|nr:hypothetical protein TNCV_1790651 [Trichonephila clavipes]
MKLRKLEFSGANAEGVYTQREEKRKTTRENNTNQQPLRRRGDERNTSERTTELAGRQSDTEISWRRSGLYGGTTRKESIAKRDHEGGGRRRRVLCSFKRLNSQELLFLIIDSTPDASHTDQLAEALRHVSVRNACANGRIARVLSGAPHKAKGMEEAALNLFEELKQDLKNCRG